MEYKEYRDNRLMESYEKYLRGETFKKVRAIVLCGDKVLLIHDKGKDVVTLPGGGVEEGENVLDAAKRETLEETGCSVEPIMVVDKTSYSVPMSIGDVDFESVREAYFVLCTLKEKGNADGLSGEYEKGRDLFLADINKLKDLHVSSGAIQTIKAFNLAGQKS